MATPEPVCYDLEVVVDDHLVSELERHGVPRGRRARLHLELVPAVTGMDADPASDGSGWPPPWFASFDGDPDLGERASEIVNATVGSH
ncbi:hypothetical protein [Frankia sp. Cas3]|uniref:hypothetical protein n=1 Tax=Frankia sp. Cas3 TaxID=3073926 RepID=UPI002AD205A1|nr:hypothetical protein [Frankia sp. Cas3]